MRRYSLSTSLGVSTTAVFSGLVAVSTMLLSIYVPATRGYFNVGEAMVYTTALLFGPFVGGLAGGIGSAASDLLLGYSIYAPATFVVKGLEGLIVGYLALKKPKAKNRGSWLAFTTFLGLGLGASVGYIGSSYYTGDIELSLGLPMFGQSTLAFVLPSVFWVLLGAVAAAAVIFGGFRLEPGAGWLVISVMAGGIVMITGYYLYEQLFLGVAALAEVPINIGQMLVGLLVAIPLSKAVRKRFPSAVFLDNY